jgi:nitrate/nitrite-specific signal transduction histidine kinase
MGDEAIGNARTQSGGTRLDVSLNYATEHDVRVKDNGVGIDPTFAEKGRGTRVRSFSKCSDSRKSCGK